MRLEKKIIKKNLKNEMLKQNKKKKKKKNATKCCNNVLQNRNKQGINV